MGKFVIECPNCGKYAEAKTGVFARKNIDCDCGYKIHIKTERLTTRTCPHCGNMFAYDQKDGTKVRCPVCHKKVVATDDLNKSVNITCAQCGAQVQTVKGADTAVCPICDHVNDVATQVRKEQIKQEGLASIIKYEGNNETLVWKHPIEDFNFGSQLIVHESQEAIFFRDGQALDSFGAGRYTLETQQLPLLEEIYDLPTDAETTFHSEVYFVNLTTQMGVKWGTDTKVRLFDPMSGMHVELGVSGEFNIRVVNPRKLLLKLVGTTSGMTHEQLAGTNGKSFFRTMIVTQVKSYLASAIREYGISVLEIDGRLMELSDALKNLINPRVAEYGLMLTDFFVSRVVTPDDDPNFKRMKEQFAEQYLGVRDEQIRKNILQAQAERRTLEAQTEAQMKIIGAQGEAEAIKLKALAEAEAYRAKALAEAEEMHAKGYTYQQETARQVSLQAMESGFLSGSGEGGGSGSGLASGILGNIGEMASLGMTLGAVGSMVNMTKDVLTPVMETTSQMGQAVSGAMSAGNATAAGWECKDCGQKGINTNYCPNCGSKKPVVQAGWNCPQCGHSGITTNFCPNCGCKKPDSAWICTNCGQKDIKTNFCPNCGQKRG